MGQTRTRRSGSLVDVRRRWFLALLVGLVATACSDATEAHESPHENATVQIEPQPAEEADEPSSISELRAGASAVVVARLVNQNRPLPTGGGDPNSDTSVFTMAVQQRLSGDVSDQFDLATVFSDVDAARVDQRVISDDVEFLLFLTPFTWGSSPRSEFTAVGSLRGVFVRPIGSAEAFISVVTAPNQIADRVTIEDVQN